MPRVEGVEWVLCGTATLHKQAVEYGHTLKSKLYRWPHTLMDDIQIQKLTVVKVKQLVRDSSNICLINNYLGGCFID